ncbi:MAG TPA: histidine kinase [Candidatus Paceibacterota bacterium]|nr:histidine kinase [Verrucomicrobiota bacterium]HRY49767.1 histidine kinase [Candidatus Paceibacterota bacterium]
MNEAITAAVVRGLGLAIFQRDNRGRLRLACQAPGWFRALWPQAAAPRAILPPGISPFLENFLVDAAAAWKTPGSASIHSGLWIEHDPAGEEHHLQAAAFRTDGRAILLIESPKRGYEERTLLVQKAHELALAYEKLQRAEQALACEKRLLEQRVRERTATLSQTNAALKREIAIRRRFAERLQGIHELDKAILAAQSPEAIAQVALRRLRHLLPYRQATLVELDAERHHATVLASIQGRRISGGGGWPLSHAQLRQCRALQSGRLQQIRNQPNLYTPPASRIAERRRIWPLIVDVPLIAGETLVGILNLATDAPVCFTAEHQEIAQEVAAQLAVTLREARLFAEVATGREQLRALSSRLVDVQEAERRFLAHELHDEIGQVLTGLKLTLEMVRKPGTRSRDIILTEAVGMVDDLMQRVRQLSLDLRPQMLDDLGLMPALDWLFSRFQKQAGLRVHFQHTPLKGRLPPQLETAVFRIVQEALTNVVRHADVSEATVRLWRDNHDRTLGVQVHDSGAGFDVDQVLNARASSGLAGMRERAVLLGGQFILDSIPKTGTRLTVLLPLAAAAPKIPIRRRKTT